MRLDSLTPTGPTTGLATGPTTGKLQATPGHGRARRVRSLPVGLAQQAHDALQALLQVLESHRQRLLALQRRFRGELAGLVTVIAAPQTPAAARQSATEMADEWRSTLLEQEGLIQNLDNTASAVRHWQNQLGIPAQLHPAQEAISTVRQQIDSLTHLHEFYTSRIARRSAREFLQSLGLAPQAPDDPSKPGDLSDQGRPEGEVNQASCPAPGLPRQDDPGGDASGGGMMAMAHDLGPPAPWSSHRAASRAPDHTLALWFRFGHAIGHNASHRRFVFADGSRVDIRSYIPQLTMSPRGVGSLLSFGAMGVGVGLVGGLLLGGPAGLVIGSVSASVAILAEYPDRQHDRAWQGYHAQFFAGPGQSSASSERYFYGSLDSAGPHLGVRIDNQVAPEGFPDFADDPARYRWERWDLGHAEVRSLPSSGNPADLISFSQSADCITYQNTLQLIDSAAGFAGLAPAPSGAAHTRLATPFALAAPPPDLLAPAR